MTHPSELEIVEALAKRLSAKGEALLAYLTAELQPFSNAQRPDLVFRPTSGARKGQVAVVECKIESAPRPSGRSFLNLIDHRKFCEESLDTGVFRYIFVSNQPVPEFSEAQLERGGVTVVAYDDDIETLTAAVLDALEREPSGG